MSNTTKSDPNMTSRGCPPRHVRINGKCVPNESLARDIRKKLKAPKVPVSQWKETRKQNPLMQGVINYELEQEAEDVTNASEM